MIKQALHSLKLHFKLSELQNLILKKQKKGNPNKQAQLQKILVRIHSQQACAHPL